MSRLYDGNAARQLQPQEQLVQKQKKERRATLITLTDKQQRESFKRRTNPFKAASSVVCVLAFFALATVLIYGYVQITEVSNEIITADTSLSELVNEQVQLEMQVASIMNSTEVESYAQNQLGMSAVNTNQIIYITIENENQGEVVVSESLNLWEKVLEFFGFR